MELYYINKQSFVLLPMEPREREPPENPPQEKRSNVVAQSAANRNPTGRSINLDILDEFWLRHRGCVLQEMDVVMHLIKLKYRRSKDKKNEFFLADPFDAIQIILDWTVLEEDKEEHINDKIRLEGYTRVCKGDGNGTWTVKN